MGKSKKIIGIDLGSYNSAVSVYEGTEIKVIPNSEGHSTTPSYVSFSKDGEIKIGESAKRQATMNPEGTIFNIKRLMGKTYDQVKHLKRPYKIVNSKGRAAVEVNGKVYSPEEISAMIIQKMKKTAEDFLGQEVEKVIITVPAHFNSDERQSTKLAGEIAGLKVERIISEPTAAVLNVDSNSNKKYAVLDFGGQTYDLSVVDVGDGVFEILSTDGDLDLGGSLFDERIVNWLAEEFLKDEKVDLRKDPMAFQRLWEASEKAKIELSSTTNTDINLPYITSVDNQPKHLVKTLSRSKFNQLTEDLVEKAMKIAKGAVEKSGLSMSDIDDVLLVGGSTRILLVQEMTEKLFGKKPNKSLNPDTCVSTGATIQGGVITGDVKDVLLLDVLSISLGLETMGNVFTKMVESNTTIPCRKEQTYTTGSDNQSSVEIKVYQGERPLTKDNKLIGNFVLGDIMPAPRGIPQISVVYDVDSNGILSVKAIDKATGKENSIRIEGATSLSKEEIERMKTEAAANEDSDKAEMEKINKLNAADSTIFQTEKSIKEFGDKLSSEDKTEIETLLVSVKEAFAAKDIEKLDVEMVKLNESWSKISTKMYSQTDTQPEENVDDQGFTSAEEVN